MKFDAQDSKRGRKSQLIALNEGDVFEFIGYFYMRIKVHGTSTFNVVDLETGRPETLSELVLVNLIKITDVSWRYVA